MFFEGLVRHVASICLILSPSLLAKNMAVAFETGEISPEILDKPPVYSPFVGRSYPDQVLFGDLRFHAEISFDAGLIGTSLDMHDAFRVARAEKIISNTGQPVQLIRPLDFLAITEHAEMLGLATAIRTSNPRLMNDEWAAALSAHWQDPEFDPAHNAFYYVRVIEIPTPRWTTHDAAFFDVPLPESVPPTVQDRAYTSPNWYTSGG